MAKRKFEVRIGINANTDNLVTDINGKQNIAGRGINDCQRIMGKADGNQILIGQSVYDILRARESYMEFLRGFPPTETKHGELIRVYQFTDGNKIGLNAEVPAALKAVEQPKETELKLTERVACYFAHAISNRELLIEHKRDEIPKIVLLWLLACETVYEMQARGLTSYLQVTSVAVEVEEGTFSEKLCYYAKMDLGFLHEFAELIENNHLCRYLDYFDHYNLWLINETGKEKLKKEWPAIWQKFDLDHMA